MECRGDRAPPAEDEDKHEEEGEEGCLAVISLAAVSTSLHTHDAQKKGGKSREKSLAHLQPSPISAPGAAASQESRNLPGDFILQDDVWLHICPPLVLSP